MSTQKNIKEKLLQALANIVCLVATEEILRGRVSEDLFVPAIAVMLLLVNLPFGSWKWLVSFLYFWRNRPTRKITFKDWVCTCIGILIALVVLKICFYYRLDFKRTFVVALLMFVIIDILRKYWLDRPKPPDIGGQSELKGTALESKDKAN